MDPHYMDKVRNISVDYIKPLVIPDDDAILIEHDENAEFVDDKTVFKKIIDAFVIDHMLGKPESKMRFLNLIADTYNDIFARYKAKHRLSDTDLIFIYKGGNILRIHKKRAMEYLPAKIQLLVNEKFDPDFQKSDDDFTIYIDPNRADFDRIINDIKSLSFSALEIIRDELALHRREYFDFYSYIDFEKNKALLGIGEKITNTFAELQDENVESQYTGYRFMEFKFDEPSYNLKDKGRTIDLNKRWTQLVDDHDVRTTMAVDNDTTSFRHDFGMKKSHDGKYHMLSPMNLAMSNRSPIFLSDNETLTFSKESGSITSFILQRAKLNVKLFIQKDGKYNFTNIAGELIDVSIPNKNDDGLVGFYHKIEKKGIQHYIENYTFEYADKKFNLNCYTIDYLIDDLGRMLFDDSGYPWNDNKYAKRIRRLFFLYLIKLIASNHTFDEISGFFLQTQGVLGEDSYQSVRPYVEKFAFMETFFKNYFDLAPRISQISDPALREQEEANYRDYVATITDNFGFLGSVFKDQVKVSRQIPVNESMLGTIVTHAVDSKYPITIEQLGGNELYYYKKYLKYKGKLFEERRKNRSFY